MILLQTHTESALKKALESTAHAWLISGAEGAGKGYIARHIASRKLGLDSTEALKKHPYYQLITPENNTISIDHIRELQKFLQLKTPGTAPFRRAIVIEDAHFMTNEAQNALLKALEEPPADTIIILTAPKTTRLRETIYSRVQQLPVLPVSKPRALEYFGTDFDNARIEKAYMMSAGHAGLLYALLHDEDHTLVSQIQRAKQLFGSTAYERLLKVDELVKQKETLPSFLQACKLIAATALHQAGANGDNKLMQRWHRSLQAIYEAEAALPRNPNTKLLLTDLFLHL